MVLDENCIGFSGFLESLIKESSLFFKKKNTCTNNIFKKKKEIQKELYYNSISANSNKQKMKRCKM